MPATPNWKTEVFENALDGVSSAVTPELIQPTQIAWGINTANRGAKPGTRPAIKFRCALPSGLVQGVSFFGVQGGMGVAQIDGRLYRLRINPASYAVEYIPLPWRNSAIIKQVYMQQTVESLVIQDGQSDPIIYNGSVAVRSEPFDGGVPRGTQMAYGNGRLWVAINEKELVAGDIRTGTIGSELQFTETDYLSGGGKLFFPRSITGLAFIATTGTSDYGALLVFGADYCESIRADITFRDLWAQTPGFVTNVLRHTGCASEWSLTEVNQDLYWRDANGGLRSIRSALADESGPGNSPISREVSRLTDYDSPQLLKFCSAISFNNRLICTSSPRLNDRGGVTWRDLIPLDFAPISTMRGKTLPAYDGQWQGINFTHLFQGQFINKSRAFAIAADDNGANSLWEIMPDGSGDLTDEYETCTDGSGVVDPLPIQCVVEHARRSFGNPAIRKRLERCDVYLWDLEGDLDLSVYWRSDNNQKWLRWEETPIEVCATTSDPEVPGETVHVWKNLLPQQRPQIKTFTIPSEIDEITRYSLMTGFEFQIRLVWTGKTKIYKTVVHSTFLDDPPWAMRDVLSDECLDNNVTGNEIVYQIPSAPCALGCALAVTRNPDDQQVAYLGLLSPEYRGVSADAELCGFEEYLTPYPSPPKRWRNSQEGGQVLICYETGISGCSVPADLTAIESYDFDAATPSLWNAATCAFTQGDYPYGIAVPPPPLLCVYLGGGGILVPSGQGSSGPAVSVGILSTVARTPTSFTESFNAGACFSSPPFYAKRGGVYRQNLTVEDTEIDAITRFEIDNPLGAFGPSVQNAAYEPRVSGYSFAYSRAQFLVQLTGFSPLTTMAVDVPIYRRIYGSADSFELATVLEYEIVTDGSGDATITGDVPNPRGFESYAGNATVFML